MKPTTGTGAATLVESMSLYYLPYGTVGLVNNLVGLWMWACILAGRAPLWPARKIKRRFIVAVFGFGWPMAQLFFMFASMPWMESDELKLMTIGFVISILANQSIAMGHAVPKTASEVKSKDISGSGGETDGDAPGGQEEVRNEAEPGGAQRDDETRRSTDSTRSSESLTNNLLIDLDDEITEKTAFLNSFSSPLRFPGMPSTEAKRSDGQDKGEGQGNMWKPKGWKLWLCVVLAILCLVLWMATGHVIILVGVVNLAKEVMAKPSENDPAAARQQHEIRDVFVISGVLQVLCTFLGIILSTFGPWLAKRMKAEEDTGEEGAAERVRKGARLVKLQFKAWSACFIVLGTLNIVIWCQYFVLAAVVGDTHGTKDLFEFRNLRLLYIILSKLLLLAH